MTDIYNLDLHEHINTSSQAPTNPHESSFLPLTILRVAGGWIYCAKEQAVFVPYSRDMIDPYKGVKI